MVIEENGNVNLKIFYSTTLPLRTGLLLLRWGCREHFVSGGSTAVVTPESVGYLLLECCILASL